MRYVKYIMVIALILSIMIVSGCNEPANYENIDQQETTTGNEEENFPLVQEESISQNEQTQNSPLSITGEVVAIVNDEEITGEKVERTQDLFLQQGQQISEEEALEQVINEVVLIQQVSKIGPEVSTQEAESIIESQLSQQGANLETYKQQLETQGKDYATELENIKNQIQIQNHLSQVFEENNVEITEEEIQAFYEMYEQQSQEEIPPYEELKEDIIMTLEQQKQQEMVGELIQELRLEANVEYK